MKYNANNLPKCGEHIKHTMSKDMMLKKNGEAWHCLGDLHRDTLKWEPIYVYAEDGEYYVGQYKEGYGFFDVRFLKTDCRDMTAEEKDHYDNARLVIT